MKSSTANSDNFASPSLLKKRTLQKYFVITTSRSMISWQFLLVDYVCNSVWGESYDVCTCSSWPVVVLVQLIDGMTSRFDKQPFKGLLKTFILNSYFSMKRTNMHEIDLSNFSKCSKLINTCFKGIYAGLILAETLAIATRTLLLKEWRFRKEPTLTFQSMVWRGIPNTGMNL